MAVLPILKWPDPRLTQHCAPVEQEHLDDLIADMFDTMYAANGRGLAAPQVGVMKRLFVMDCTWKEGKRSPMVMINPSIMAVERVPVTMEEGCLSIPDQYAEVTRPKEVQVKWMDRDGHEQSETFDGLWATCVQHEIDHLNGKLFIDYLKPLKRQMITRKMQKLKRERARD